MIFVKIKKIGTVTCIISNALDLNFVNLETARDPARLKEAIEADRYWEKYINNNSTVMARTFQVVDQFLISLSISFSFIHQVATTTYIFRREATFIDYDVRYSVCPSVIPVPECLSVPESTCFLHRCS